MAGGSLFRALQRQNNLSGFWGNVYDFALGKYLKKFSDKTKKKQFDPGMNLNLDVNVQGKEVQPDIEIKPTVPEQKLFDPSIQGERPGAGANSGDNGPGFIPEVRTQNTPGVKQQPQQTTKTDPNTMKFLSGVTPNEINDKIDADLQEFIVYASKFGVKGQEKIKDAMNIASLNYQKPLPEGTIVNKNGIATRMIFDPSNGKTVFNSLKDDKGGDVKYFDLYPEKETDQKIKEKSLKPTLSPVRIPSTDGVTGDKLGFMNMDDYSVKPTDINWEDYNTNPLNYDKLKQDMEKVLIKESGKHGSGKKNSGSGNIGDNSNVPLLMYNGKVVTYQNASDFGIPPDIVKNYYSGNPKAMKKAKNQMVMYGDKITYQSPSPETTGNQPGNNPPADTKTQRRSWWGKNGAYWQKLNQGGYTKDYLKGVAKSDLENSIISQDEFNAINNALK